MSEKFRIHFVASQVDGAEQALESLEGRYGNCPLEEANVIVALGGDGFMLRTLHRFLPTRLPVYGMKLGNVGFLMNRFHEDGLQQRLNAADTVELNPLCMEALTEAGSEATALAINEVSLLRQLNQAA
ncbi:MAG: NAD(+)/NADH kinase, partial [Gammaproteobacteria bacterium]